MDKEWIQLTSDDILCRASSSSSFRHVSNPWFWALIAALWSERSSVGSVTGSDLQSRHAIMT